MREWPTQVDLESIRVLVSDNSEVKRWTERGWCRKWTSQVMDLLEMMPDVFVEVEAREVEISTEYWHTFVSARATDGEMYFFDSGSCKGEPFFGKEVEAPRYLSDSRVDGMIMNERRMRCVGNR